MAKEQLFASFVLDQEEELEIALPVENVTEASRVSGRIRLLPSSVEFVEGIMNLRDDVIPVINLKRRLGLSRSFHDSEAKIAVVMIFGQCYGILFDDIRDVLRVELSTISPINSELQGDDKIISGIINLDNGRRTLELLDLNYLIPDECRSRDKVVNPESELIKEAETERPCSRYVTFSCSGQEYGVNVEYSQEIAFLGSIDEMYENGCIEGALQLRGRTIPVMSAGYLLAGAEEGSSKTDERRILILKSDDLIFGIIVDRVREIITVLDDEILPMPDGDDTNVIGIYRHSNGPDIMLFNVTEVISSQINQLKSIGCIKKEDEDAAADARNISRHIITESCHLIFSIGKNFAVEIRDVREIIDYCEIMSIPKMGGFNRGVINLRGQIMPVVNLRRFYNYPDAIDPGAGKLIICRGKSRLVALEVDDIVTIYKQEQYYQTPSLKPELSARKDTLDRLIDFLDDTGLSEHVLVINVHNLIRNHLGLRDEPEDQDKLEDNVKN